MAPTHLSKTHQSKRNKSVMSIAEKLKILDLLKQGEIIAAVARKFEVNESTIRSIRKNEQKIRQSASKLGSQAKFIKISRDENIEKLEDMLLIWIQDLIHKKIPISTIIIREQAMIFFKHLHEKNPTKEVFSASKGWFEKFKSRFSLHNVKFSGESAAADRVAAEAFIPLLKEAIEAKGYLPAQIFNCDETGLFWKRMPNRTWLTKEEKTAPGFKAAKDRFTLLFCTNFPGSFKCKPMLIYKSENPRALKGKRKEHLPVFWKSNQV